MSVVLSILSALFYGAGDFSGGLATRKNPVGVVLVFSQLIGLTAILAVIPFVGPSSPLPADFAWGALAGLGGALGLWLLYHGIATTSTAVVSPTAAIVGTALPVISGLAFGERPGPFGWLGILVAIPAIALLTAEPENAAGAEEETEVMSSERRKLTRRALLLGFGAGIGFGFFFVAISRSSETAGLWPLVSARTASVTAVALVSLFSGTRFRLSAENRWAVPVAGLLDMAANVTFLFALKGGLLMLVSVITSLYPAPTVLLSRFVFGEHLSAHRLAGLVLAIFGVALLSI